MRKMDSILLCIREIAYSYVCLYVFFPHMILKHAKLTSCVFAFHLHFVNGSISFDGVGYVVGVRICGWLMKIQENHRLPSIVETNRKFTVKELLYWEK